MLPAIQENILLLKSFQVATQILLCLVLAYLMGEFFFKLPSLRPRYQPNPKKDIVLPPSDQRPKLLSGWRTGLFLVLGLSFNLLAMKIAFRASLLQGSFWAAVMVPFTIGVILLLWARQRTTQGPPSRLSFNLGLTGEILLFGVVLLLITAESLLIQPEYWPFIDTRPLLFSSWHGLIRFAEYILLAFLLAAAARLTRNDDTDRKRAHPVTLFAILLLPFLLLLEVLSMPALARSLPFFVLAGLFLLVLAATAFLVSASCFGSPLKIGKPVFGGVGIIIVLWVFMSFTARQTVLTPITLAGLSGIKHIAEEDPDKFFAPEEEPAAPAPAEAAASAIFNNKCAVCHKYDQRLIGPPLNTVLPKYAENPAALQKFLLNPVKIDPDYPAMPNPNLTPAEAAAIAEFLLEDQS